MGQEDRRRGTPKINHFMLTCRAHMGMARSGVLRNKDMLLPC